MKLPDGIYFKKVASAGYNYHWGLDQNNDLWKWGYRFYDYDVDDNVDPLFAGSNVNNQTPQKVVWFEKRSIKVLDFAPCQYGCILKTRNENGGLEMYLVYNGDYNYQL